MEIKEKLGSILLLDDDPASNFLNGTIIKSYGIKAHIQVAATGQDALDYISKKGIFEGARHDAPELIFVDINMPKMDGIEFLKKIKNSRYKNIPIVIFTTSDYDQENMIDGNINVCDLQFIIT